MSNCAQQETLSNGHFTHPFGVYFLLSICKMKHKSVKRRSVKRTTGKRRSVKRRSVKRATGKRRSKRRSVKRTTGKRRSKRHSVKRTTGKRRSVKRRSVKRRSVKRRSQRGGGINREKLEKMMSQLKNVNDMETVSAYTSYWQKEFPNMKKDLANNIGNRGGVSDIILALDKTMEDYARASRQWNKKGN
jgi:hypothetical protein